MTIPIINVPKSDKIVRKKKTCTPIFTVLLQDKKFFNGKIFFSK